MTITEVMTALADKWGYGVDVANYGNTDTLYIKNRRGDCLRFGVLNSTMIQPEARRLNNQWRGQAVTLGWQSLDFKTCLNPIDLNHPDSISILEKIIEEEFLEIERIGTLKGWNEYMNK